MVTAVQPGPNRDGSLWSSSKLEGNSQVWRVFSAKGGLLSQVPSSRSCRLRSCGPWAAPDARSRSDASGARTARPCAG